MDIVISKNRIPIRLTDERWAHITDEHCELAGLRLEVLNTVEDPLKIFAEGLNPLAGGNRYGQIRNSRIFRYDTGGTARA